MVNKSIKLVQIQMSDFGNFDAILTPNWIKFDHS